MTSHRASAIGLTSALVLSVAVTTPGAAGADAACEVRYTPDELTVSSRPVRVLAETGGGPPGQLEEVRTEPGSGIVVLEAVRQENAPVPTWVLQLDISEAAPGSWTIELSGERDDCTGRLELREL